VSAQERPTYQLSATTLARLAVAEQKFRELAEQKKLQPSHNEIPSMLRKQA